MTVSELKNKLQKLEDEGKGDYQVIDFDTEKPAKVFVNYQDKIIYIDDWYCPKDLSY